MAIVGRRSILAALGVAITVAAIVFAITVAPAATGTPVDPSVRPSQASSSRATAVGSATPSPDRVISADVVVYGATPSGILAAVSAARLGASVILATPESQVGGMMTSGLSHADVGKASLIGGLTHDVFRTLLAAEVHANPRPKLGWTYEPHVAGAVFDKLLRDAHVVVELNAPLDRTVQPVLEGNRIVEIRMTNGTHLLGKVFIDASYEGDLMAAAGVPFALGRESRAAFGEPLGGVRIDQTTPPVRLISGVDAAGNPLPGVTVGQVVEGSSDGLVQSATFRLCVTRNPSNRIPFVAPAGYDPATFAIVGRKLARIGAATGSTPHMTDVVSLSRIPDGKADLNSFGPYSTDFLDGIAGWASANDAGRQALLEQHRAWVEGFLWYLETSPDVPATVRTEVSGWGLCADEFRATGGWPPDLYIREARRMIGAIVLTQSDLQRNVTKPDAIAIGTYRIDAHYVERVLGNDGLVRGEGQMSGVTTPYQIPYSAIVPPAGSVDNLLVSVAISASHVAWTSIRVEPTLMEIGEAAGVAAGLAVRDGVGVREVQAAAIQHILLRGGGILDVPPVPPALTVPGSTR